MKSMNWDRVLIKDACLSIIDCVNKTAPTVQEPTPYKMMRTSNVKGGKINLSDVRYATEGVYRRWTRRQVPRMGDVILTREAPLGEVGMLRTNETVFLGQRLVSYRANPECLDNRFLLYSLQADYLQAQIKALGSGATVEHMRVPDAEKLELRLPALSAQHKIAAILSAYDDLIENNTRRIAILEEMARMLYREWFVNFRFPGHESVPTVDSPLGPIPDGWKVRRASDAILVNPATRVSREGGKPFVPMSSLQDNSMLIDNIQMRSGNAGAKFRNGDTLFARITPCLENGKTAYVQFLSAGETAFGSTEFIVLRSKTLSSQLVYLLARSNEFRDNAIKSMSGASGRQRVRDACFDRFLFAHPPPDVVRAFTDGVSPLFGATHLLALKNANLRHTRDLLLPKLISGELHVGDLDIEVGEVGE